MKWTEAVWEKAQGQYSRILEHPFVKELAAGTLSEQAFSRYIVQDELYLADYGQNMARLAAMMDDAGDKALFESFAVAGLDSEKGMHQILMERFHIATGTLPSSVTLTYNAHTREALDSGVRELALAAVLPCMWVYNRVGQHILAQAELQSNPYKEWIMEYGDETFTAGTQRVLEMADRWAEAAGEELRSRMDELFLEAVDCEYAFWDYGYRGEEGDYSYLKV